MQTNLKRKENDTLLTELKSLIDQERMIATEILHYLREVERRQLHATLGFSSLFDFATQELGYSASAAQRRIQAMRLLTALPEIEPNIRSGTLSLTAAAQAQGFFKLTDRSLRESKKPPLTNEFKTSVVESMLGKSTRECERILVDINPDSVAKMKERVRSLPQGNTLIQFIADPAFMKKLMRLRDLLSHKCPYGRYDDLFRELADIALKKLEKKFTTVA